ncbi:MAG TPA: hypothetical protein VH144_00100 [Candidatus Saccharimonadales bacterium]|jgi:hypothetical protein|nr:hypothetical protein [Candidatus Saccharimonadales bacterium]
MSSSKFLSRLPVLGGVSLLIAEFIINILTAVPANAILSESPDSADFSQGNNIYQVVSRAGGVSRINVPISEVNFYISEAYFATHSTATIVVQDADHCEFPTRSFPSQPGGAYTPDTEAPGGAQGARTTQYEIYGYNANESGLVNGGGVITPVQYGVVIKTGSATACSQRTRTMQVAKSQMVPSTNPGHAGYYVGRFRARYLSADGWNSFQLAISGNAGIFGYYAKNAAGVQFALKQGNPGPGSGATNGPFYSQYNIKFAPDCTINGPVSLQSYPLQVYDDDQGTDYQRLTLSYQLFEADSTGATRLIDSGTPPRVPTGEGRTYTINKPNVFLRPGFRYIWRWNQVHELNALQFKIPFDSIFYTLQCPQKDILKPSVGVSSTSVEEGDVVTFTYKISRGTSASGANGSCALTTTSGSVPPPPNTPVCNGGNFNMIPGQTQLTATSGPITVTSANANGPRGLCQSLFITPNAPDVADTPNPSEACVKVVKKPLVQFNSGDVWAGGSYKQAGVCAANNSSIQTNARTLTDGREVGSHVEYGAFALGDIHAFGAGARPHINDGAAGAPDASERFVFANSRVDNGGALQYTLGNYGDDAHCLTDFTQLYQNASVDGGQGGAINVASLPDGYVHRVTGDRILNASTPIGAGKHIILYVDGNVTINGNIAYSDGPYTNIAGIPQVTIIAGGNITVQSPVTQLSGLYQAKGSFSTCETAPPLTTSVCNQQLNINGAVVAKNTILYRTGGTTSSPLVSQQAAERFNLTPDIYLSLYSGSSTQLNAQTVQEIDLPPRY